MKCLDPITIRFHAAKDDTCGMCPERAVCDGVSVTTLARDVRYELDGGRIFTVKAGFCFDGASIPPFAWSIIGHPYHPRYITAALLHDALYHSHVLEKDVADAMFRELLRLAGVSYPARMLMARAVGLFGGNAYYGADAKHWRNFVTMEA